MQRKMKIIYSNHAESRMIERNLSRADVTRMLKASKKKLKHKETMKLLNPANNLYVVVIREHNNIVVKSVYQVENKKYDLKIVR